MPEDLFAADIEALRAEGRLGALVGELKSGKEATVYLARDPAGRPVALKHYRPMHGRGFATSARYREGRHLGARDRRALEKRTRFGRRLARATWIDHEYRTLRRLHRRGLPVPRPLAAAPNTIVLEYLQAKTGGEAPAPRLVDVPLDPASARSVHRLLMLAIIRMFEAHVVHADLSPYNVLWAARSEGDGEADLRTDLVRASADLPRRVVIIDLPQAVDPRRNSAAGDLLAHDVAAITDFCRRFAPDVDDHDLARRLLRRLHEPDVRPASRDAPSDPGG